MRHPRAHAGVGAEEGLHPVAVAGEHDDEIVTLVTFSAEGRRTRVTIRVQSGFTPEWGEGARMGWAESLDKLGEAIADDMAIQPSAQTEL